MRSLQWIVAGLVVCLSGCGKVETPTVGTPAPSELAAAPADLTAAPADLTAAPVGFEDTVPPPSPGPAPLVRLMQINGCLMCERIDGLAKDLEKQHGKDLRSDRFNSETPAGRKFLRSLGMRRHGVILFDRAGKPVWRNDSHSLDRPTLAAAVAAAVQGVTPPQETGIQANESDPAPHASCEPGAHASCAPGASPTAGSGSAAGSSPAASPAPAVAASSAPAAPAAAPVASPAAANPR